MLRKARRTDLSGRAGRPDGVIYRQQYIRCGRPGCRRCPPAGPGHGPYWYGFYWDYQQRTTSFYVGKDLPRGVEVLPDPALQTDADLAPSEPITDRQEVDSAANVIEVINNARDRRPSGEMPPC
ncbi:MAG: hypothetical protein E6I75_17580 [Chloroflexi bacterium]|nr:MAG: hypothetical protein AUI36_05610 [Cyanobacteria bacterium 13_1_40CM_2_61_4]TME31947.1 MAG: hypothetical protein E6I75_17580 [Chloroflexota bacterium]